MISRAIKSLCPDAEFAVEDEDYSTIRWFKQPETIPTLEEVENESQRLTQLDVDLSYQKKRRAEYPSIGDQLDALWKGEAALEEMRAKVMAIKNKYSKPE